MNIEQVKSAVRWLIATIGPFLIAHGYATDATLTLASGILISIIPFVWGLFAHTETNAVAVVDTLAKQPDSGVKAVVTDATPTGRDLAQSMPGDTTVVAGTNAATAAAKS